MSRLLMIVLARGRWFRAPLRGGRWSQIALACLAAACDGSGGPDNTPCTQGTFDIQAHISGVGFDYGNGREVRAMYGSPTRDGQSSYTWLENGSFQLSFESGNGTCNLGGTLYEAIALFIDVDGDGMCRLAMDQLFVVTASGGPSGGNNQIALSPAADRCPPVPEYLAPRVFEAARFLCPEIDDCIPSCGPHEAPFERVDVSCRRPGDAGSGR